MEVKGFSKMAAVIVAAAVVCAAVLVVSGAVYAEVRADDAAPRSICLGADVLADGCCTKNAQTVWYAERSWRVLSYDDAGNKYLKRSGAMTLFEAMPDLRRCQFRDNAEGAEANDYKGSKLQEAVDALYNDMFEGELQKPVLKRDLEVDEYKLVQDNGTILEVSNGVSGSAASGYLWPLSTAEEVEMVRAFSCPTEPHWLRSPGEADDKVAYIITDIAGLDYGLSVEGDTVTEKHGFRPAFYMDLNAVLYTSANDDNSIVTGSDALGEAGTNDTGEWKVTLLDDGSIEGLSGHKDFRVESIVQRSDPDADLITVSYSGAAAGDNEYVSAMIINSGKIKYYGRIKAITSDKDKSGDVEINIKDKMDQEAGDELYLFSEQVSGKKGTGFASDLKRVNVAGDEDMITFTVTFKVENGAWDDKTTGDKIIKLSRREDEDRALVLREKDIPAAGGEPAEGYRKGSWNTEPYIEKIVSKDVTYTYTYIAAPKPAGIMMGSDVLAGSVNTESAQIIYYGKRSDGAAYPWYVIGYEDEEGSVASAPGNMTLLAAANLDYCFFNSSRENNYYGDSDLKKAVDTIAGNILSSEKAAIVSRTLLAGSYEGEDTDCVAELQVDDALLWPLSSKEAKSVDKDLLMMDPELVSIDDWWLRSPGNYGGAAAYVSHVGYVEYNGDSVKGYQNPDGSYVAHYGVRPAFNMRSGAVIFTSAAVDGKSASGSLAEVEGNDTGRWKLTLLDDGSENAVGSGHKGFDVSADEVTYNAKTKEVTIPYHGAVSGGNEYISAIIKRDDEIKYYGRIAEVSNSDDSVTVKINCMEKGDKLYIFNEQHNSDGKRDSDGTFTSQPMTDYASGLEEVPVADPPGHDWQFDGFTWTGNETDGYTAAAADYVCKDNSKHVKTVTEVALTSKAVEPTCTAGGKTVYTAEVTSANSLDGKEHSESKDGKPTQPAEHDWKAATCTEPETCKNCGITQGSPLGHKWKYDSIAWTGNETDGYKKAVVKYVCEHDQSHIDTLKADMDIAVTEPTCTAGGKTTYTASVDASESMDGAAHSENKDAKATAALGHKWAFDGFTWTGSAETGYTAAAADYVCIRDGSHKDTREAALTSEVTKPTCTGGGKTTYKALIDAGTSLDGKEHSEQKEALFTDPAGHDWGSWETILAPTCISQGFGMRICKSDPVHQDFQVMPADTEAHDFGEWKFVTEPETNKTGSRKRVCTRDASHTETERFPASSRLFTKMKSKGKTSLVITWTEVPEAEGYEVWFVKCDHKKSSNVCKKIKTVEAGKTLKVTKKKLKKRTAYKAFVAAYKTVDGQKVYTDTSLTVHAYTSGGDKKYTNPNEVTVKKSKYTLAAGNTAKIKASVTGKDAKKKLIPTSHSAKVRYMTTDPAVATVSRKGRIKAKAAGSCRICVIAASGIRKSVRVKVK